MPISNGLAIMRTLFYLLFLMFTQLAEGKRTIKTFLINDDQREHYMMSVARTHARLKSTNGRVEDRSRVREEFESQDEREEKVQKELRTFFDRSLFDDQRCPKLPEVLPYPEPLHLSNSKCRLTFLRYNMSPLENYFYSNLHKPWVTNSPKAYCKFLEKPSVKKSLDELVVALSRYHDMKSLKEEQVKREIFSSFTYRMECEGEGEEIFDSYIEPLVGMTRHPWAVDCKHKTELYLMDKSYILTQTFEDNPYYTRVGRSIRYIGMDLGASLWLGGSQDFLNYLYEKKGRNFDQFHMYEGAKFTEAQI